MGKQNYFFSGITDILILAILCEHDSYVYEIVKFIKEKSNGCLSISQNTVTQSPTSLLTKEKSANIQSLSAKSAHEFIIISRTKVGHIMKTFWKVFIMHTAV